MTLTIFTPAYNRAAMLPRLYESLLSQGRFDFEWLIVDDGSTDDTEQIAQRFTGEGCFPVRYVRKENGGKHTAHNLALMLAQGNWFFCVDSDDYLASDAVSEIIRVLKELEPDQGIIAYKADPAGKLFSKVFPDGLSITRLNELMITRGCNGEFSLIFPIKVIRQYPFPTFAGERFVTESVVYDRIDPLCEMVLLPKTVTICEYQADGYSQNANGVMARNPSGFCMYFMQRIDLMPSLVSRVSCAGKYWCFRWIAKNGDIPYSGRYKLLTYLSAPLGLIFRAYYKFVRGF